MCTCCYTGYFAVTKVSEILVDPRPRPKTASGGKDRRVTIRAKDEQEGYFGPAVGTAVERKGCEGPDSDVWPSARGSWPSWAHLTFLYGPEPVDQTISVRTDKRNAQLAVVDGRVGSGECTWRSQTYLIHDLGNGNTAGTTR